MHSTEIIWSDNIIVTEPNFHDWLYKPNNISAAMRKLANVVTLQVLNQQLQLAYNYEYHAFELTAPEFENVNLAESSRKTRGVYPGSNYKMTQFSDHHPQFEQQKSGSLPLIREICLLGDGVPWSFGRVVVAPATYAAYKATFDNLDTQFIGDTLLHNAPDVIRSRFKYTCLLRHHALYQNIYSKLNIKPSEQLWARCSTFYLKNLPLIITEVYLPNIPAYPLTH